MYQGQMFFLLRLFNSLRISFSEIYPWLKFKVHFWLLNINCRGPFPDKVVERKGITISEQLNNYSLLSEIHSSYAMVSSGIPRNMPRVTCIFRIHTTNLSHALKKYNYQPICPPRTWKTKNENCSLCWRFKLWWTLMNLNWNHCKHLWRLISD